MPAPKDETSSLAIPMDPNAVFNAIGNSRRRRVLLSLSRSSGETPADELAVEIAAIENALDPSRVGSDERTSVYIALTQRHLEALDEVGAVDYNDRSKTVSSTDATEPLAEYIRRLQTACYKPESEETA
jgi:DNA-binding transcriptional ArsR family regulator